MSDKIAATEDFDKLLLKKDFRQFLRDLRDLSQAAERRLSSRGRNRIAALNEVDLHDYATIAAYLAVKHNLRGEALQKTLLERHPEIDPSDLDQILRYAHQLYGKRFPNPQAQKNAREYNQKYGLEALRPLPYVDVNADMARKIAEEYDNLPTTPPDDTTEAGRRSKRAYQIFVAEVRRQFDHLPVQVEPWTAPGQPYKNSRELFHDIDENNHMYVFYGGDDHPFLSREDNYKLRAIHDYYGHAAHGFEFGPRGEENAWLKHSQMFSPEAVPAATAETRGQNSFVNFGKHAEHNRLFPEQTIFAPQKAHVLPDEYNRRDVPLFRFSSRLRRISTVVRASL